ncbi:recombinase family protein [Streptomyces sp. NPDC020800]|uniref:recombinase family protein n=1 Tax=Streptomyces sp. NPDC020800 TaxID=3365092 RepID=UPI0037B269DA
MTSRTGNERSARAINARIVGEAEDLDVSASRTTPFERPELGEWLSEPSRFDVILWTLLAFAAQMEAQAIRERVQGAAEAIRGMSLRWRGARPPYPYMPAPMPDGAGKTLIPDPDAVKVIERIIRTLMEDESASATSSIAIALNSEEPPVPSPRDHWAIKQGRETGGKTGGKRYERGTAVPRFKWSASTINALLRSPALMGHIVHGGVPVRDSVGRPALASSTPVLTREEFDNVGALLDARKRNTAPPTRRDTNALLLRIIHCYGGTATVGREGDSTGEPAR